MTDFGTEPFKLRRNDSPDTSYEASEAVDTTNLEAMVYGFLSYSKNNVDGMIQDDVLAAFPRYPYSSITARFRGLFDKGLIYYQGDKRKRKSGRNQRIMRVNRRKTNRT